LLVTLIQSQTLATLSVLSIIAIYLPSITTTHLVRVH
jgi:hypothetical protein